MKMNWLSGTNIRIIRLNLGMKQSEMARRLGISKQLLCGVESGDCIISPIVETKLDVFFQSVTDEQSIIQLLESHSRLNNGKQV
jgi:transcriptional regulator with XRE-family HTH domain